MVTCAANHQLAMVSAIKPGAKTAELDSLISISFADPTRLALRSRTDGWMEGSERTLAVKPRPPPSRRSPQQEGKGPSRTLPMPSTGRTASSSIEEFTPLV